MKKSIKRKTNKNISYQIYFSVVASLCLLLLSLINFTQYNKEKNHPSVQASSSLTLETFNLFNELRSYCGIKSFVWNDFIVQGAQNHVNEMVALNYFSHSSPSGKSYGAWAYEAGYTGFIYGEILAANYTGKATSFVSQWYNSPGHRTIMLHPVPDEVGIAYNNGIMLAKMGLSPSNRWDGTTQDEVADNCTNQINANPPWWLAGRGSGIPPQPPAAPTPVPVIPAPAPTPTPQPTPPAPAPQPQPAPTPPAPTTPIIQPTPSPIATVNPDSPISDAISDSENSVTKNKDSKDTKNSDAVEDAIQASSNPTPQPLVDNTAKVEKYRTYLISALVYLLLGLLSIIFGPIYLYSRKTVKH